MGGQSRCTRLPSYFKIASKLLHNSLHAIFIHYQPFAFGVLVVETAFVRAKGKGSTLVGAVFDAPTTVFASGVYAASSSTSSGIPFKLKSLDGVGAFPELNSSKPFFKLALEGA